MQEGRVVPSIIVMVPRLLAERGGAQEALEPHPLMAHVAPQLVLSDNHLSKGLEVLLKCSCSGACS